MKVTEYTGPDKPVTLGITRLTSCTIVNICLNVSESRSEDGDAEYHYISIEGSIPELSARTILEEICLLGYFGFVNIELINELELKCNESDMLSIVRDVMLQHISFYDSSSSVNSFKYSGQNVWLDKDTRVGLVNSTNMLKLVGKEETTLWFGDMPITIPCDAVLQMLCAIEVYALECYNVTAQHKVAVSQLESIEEILAYDITAGYPEHPSF